MKWCPRWPPWLTNLQIPTSLSSFFPFMINIYWLLTVPGSQNGGWNIGVCVCFFSGFFFFFFCFFGAHLWHRKFPGWGSKWGHNCQPGAQPQEHQIWAGSATYTTAHSNTGSLIHWARPGVKCASSWILLRFISTEPRWELWNLGIYSLDCKTINEQATESPVNTQMIMSQVWWAGALDKSRRKNCLVVYQVWEDGRGSVLVPHWLSTWHVSITPFLYFIRVWSVGNTQIFTELSWFGRHSI